MNLFDLIPDPSPWTPPEPPCLDGIQDIEVDTETTGLDWRHGDRPIGIGLCLPGDRPGTSRTFYLPWGHRGGGNLDEETVKRWAQRELRGKRITNAGTKFDVHMFRAWGVDLEAQGNEVSDVQHYAALLDDWRKRFSQEVLVQDFLPGSGEEKVLTVNGMVLDPARMASYHAGVVAVRAEGDVRQVRKLREAMWPLLTAQDLHRVRDLEDNLIYPVCEMEKNSAPLDVPRLREWTEQVEGLLNRLLWEVAREVGFQCDPNKAKDWERLFKHLGLTNTARTAGTEAHPHGQPSFTDLVLKQFSHPTVLKQRAAVKLSSLLSKYFKAYLKAIGEDGLLHYDLHQLRDDEGGTISGRFSAVRVNIQQVFAVKKQIKRWADLYTLLESMGVTERFLVRELFVPRTGPWLAADAKQIEYRLFAHYANSEKILKAYAEDPQTDFHNLVMGMVQTVRPDITRERTKDCNFAKIYGAGKGKIAEMLELPRAESDAFVALYDAMFPEVPVLLSKASRLANERGYVMTALGRRIRFPRDPKTGARMRLHKALNGVIQGSAADIMKLKIVELHKERNYTGLLLRMTVHDEVDGDAQQPETAARVQEVLDRQSLPLRVPILWDVQTGANWKECK